MVLKIITFIILYLIIGCVCSLLYYLYTEDTDMICECILAWPFCAIVIGLCVLSDSIINLGNYINKKRANKEKDIWDTFTDEQKTFIEYMIGQALNNKEDE
jgi:hypothetical protein